MSSVYPASRAGAAARGARSGSASGEVGRVAANLPFALRTFIGLAALVVGANTGGVLVVTIVAAAMNANSSRHQVTVVIGTTVILLVSAALIGVGVGALVQRRTLRWLARGHVPSADDAHRALRLPLDLALISFVLWSLCGVVISIVASAVGDTAGTVWGIFGGTIISGMTAAGLTYLLVARVSRRVALLALAASPPERDPAFALRTRLLLGWALTTGAPILGLLLVLTAPPGKQHIVGVGIAVAVVALLVSGTATALAARGIGEPLHGVVAALREVADGDLDVAVPVSDAGEIGLVQSGFNDMMAGLRERERIQDLFGRHVGPAVAERAIADGVTLRGESREVVALFVDITGSTRLTRATEPTEFVAMLNRFFAIVVDEVEGNGGLVNKFEGDAALCVFGAPADLPDPATAALRAARGIRDRVGRLGELGVGIGVASGPVIAGQIGAASRLEYTVIGDAVNEAARLTDQAKRVDGSVLASAATVEAATADERAHWVAGGLLQLRGRDAPTPAYRTAVAVRA